MKAAALILEMASGNLEAIPAPRSTDLIAVATKIRKDGEYNGKKVNAGVLLSSDRPFPVKEFRVDVIDIEAAPKKKKAAPKKKKAAPKKKE